jgi:hypothetical protein
VLREARRVRRRTTTRGYGGYDVAELVIEEERVDVPLACLDELRPGDDVRITTRAGSGDVVRVERVGRAA